MIATTPATSVRMTARNTIEWLPGFEAKNGSVVTTALTNAVATCEEKWWPDYVDPRGNHRPSAPTPESQPETLTLAPNPASNEVSLSLGNMQDIRILTLTGTEVYAQTFTNPMNATTLPVIAYPTGIYLVRVTTTGGEVFTQKLIVQPR